MMAPSPSRPGGEPAPPRDNVSQMLRAPVGASELATDDVRRWKGVLVTNCHEGFLR